LISMAQVRKPEHWELKDLQEGIECETE
jgi:hypothetical protein